MAKYASEDFRCILTGFCGATLHHLYTQGSRPDLRNEEWNLIPVIQLYHDLFHKRGTAYMAKSFPSVRYWLLDKGWEFDEFSGKWRHYLAIDTRQN